jgi:hypothetical protein
MTNPHLTCTTRKYRKNMNKKKRNKAAGDVVRENVVGLKML